MINYLRYVIETAFFNYHYKVWLGSDIDLFDNCKWKDYKRRL